jgi:hypothetical protein
MSNKEYEQLDKWIHKYRLDNKNCKECQEQCKHWGEIKDWHNVEDLKLRIYFEHLWNNPF